MNKFTEPSEADREAIQEAFGNFMERYHVNIKADRETLLNWQSNGWVEERIYGVRVHWLRKVFLR